LNRLNPAAANAATQKAQPATTIGDPGPLPAVTARRVAKAGFRHRPQPENVSGVRVYICSKSGNGQDRSKKASVGW